MLALALGACNSAEPDPGGDDDDAPDAPDGCDPCAYTPAVTASDFTTLPDFTITSSVADRTLPVLIRYPTDATAPLGVVLWAHGGAWSNNSQNSNEDWSTVLAEAGYAVVHWSTVAPDDDQLAQMCIDAGVTDPTLCDDLSLAPEAGEDDQGDNPFNAIAIARPGDGRTILDALPGFAAQFEGAGIEVDFSRPVVAGWSGGSQVALQLAGATRDLAESLPPWSDPSDVPVAFIALSPQGPGFRGFYAADDGTSWDAVRGATLVVTGDCDEKVANDLTGPIRREAYENMPAGDKRLLYSTLPKSDEAKHATFNLDGLASEDDDVLALTDALISLVVAFTDAHAREDAPAQDWLDRDDVLTMVDGSGEWLSK